MAKRVKIINVSRGIVRLRGTIELKVGQHCTLVVTDEEYKHYINRPKIYKVTVLNDDVEFKNPLTSDTIVKQSIPVDVRDNETVEKLQTIIEEKPIAEDIKETVPEEPVGELPETSTFADQISFMTKKELIDLAKKTGVAQDFKEKYGKTVSKATKEMLIEYLIEVFNVASQG